MEAVFKRASRRTGEAYYEAEKELRSAPDESTSTLRAHLKSNDPVDRLLAQVVLNWFDKKKSDYDGALKYLDGLPKRLERTPVPSPPPSGVAAYLDAEYDDRVVDLLLLRLIKDPELPRWRIRGVLLYINDHPQKDTLSAFVRYTAEVENDEYRDTAIEGLKPLRGDDLNQQITAEHRRFEDKGKDFPPELTALKTK